MNKPTIEMHERDCDKCCGSGKVLDAGVYELIRRWRKQMHLSGRTLAALSNIPYTRYCKFENGRTAFSEARLRIILQILAIKQEETNETLA